MELRFMLLMAITTECSAASIKQHNPLSLVEYKYIIGEGVTSLPIL
jgi:hypothetical protein